MRKELWYRLLYERKCNIILTTKRKKKDGNNRMEEHLVCSRSDYSWIDFEVRKLYREMTETSKNQHKQE